MKQLKLLFIVTVLSITCYGQVKETEASDLVPGKKKAGLFEGRSLYLGFSAGSSTPPHPAYDFGMEAGLWGITKATTVALTLDAVRQDTLNKGNHWLGIKSYLTIFGTDKACFMAYLAPKIETEDLRKVLLEIGINPCFNITKHILFSMTICDQLTNTSGWNFGGSLGLVFIK